jgi:hypothetical protein
MSIAKMKEVFGDGFVRMGVGRVIEIGEGTACGSSHLGLCSARPELKKLYSYRSK